MLAFLKIKDFALIDDLEIEFGEGLNIITGETGTGKSILVNALFSFLNPKMKEDVVREGKERAEIFGQFFLERKEYFLKRTISVQGRSRAFLNEEPISLGKMEEVVRGLLSFCSQNEYQELLEKENHLLLLDKILSLEEEREDLRRKIERLNTIKKEIEEKEKILEGSKKEIEILEFQIREIERENIKAQEEEELKERIKMLKQKERIRRSIKALKDILYEAGDAFEGKLKRILSEIKAIEEIGEIERLKKRIEALLFEVEDIYGEIREFERHIPFDEEELPRLEERLSRIFDLKSKYGGTIEEIKSYKEKAEKRIEFLKGLSDEIRELQRELQGLEREVSERARRLSEKRKKGGESIERDITSELSGLAMKDAHFKILIEDKGYIDGKGMDDVEFLIRTNIGEGFRPLRRIASGGELSRIMLSIKKVMGGDEGKTLIFDEVDTGIGGRVADIVGKRLKELTKKYQVICITHLPQIAVYGDHHFLVEKKVEGERTKTFIKRLDKKGRIMEVARMIGGQVLTEKALQRAEEMLEYAEKGAY